jgi:hypothetical protein
MRILSGFVDMYGFIATGISIFTHVVSIRSLLLKILNYYTIKSETIKYYFAG